MAMVSLGFAAVSDENFEKCVKNPGKVAPARSLLTQRAPADAIKHALRQKARTLGTSLSDPDHIREKLPPTEECFDLLLADKTWVVFTLVLPEDHFVLDLKNGKLKQVGAGFEIQDWNPLDPKWGSSMASKARLDVTEQNLASVEPSKMPAPPVWTFYIGVSGDMAARIIAAPREARAYILDLFEHREMGNLVRKQAGHKIANMMGNGDTIPMFEDVFACALLQSILDEKKAVEQHHIVTLKISCYDVASTLQHIPGMSSNWVPKDLEKLKAAPLHVTVASFSLTDRCLQKEQPVGKYHEIKNNVELDDTCKRLAESLDFHSGEVKKIKAAIEQLEAPSPSEPQPR